MTSVPLATTIRGGTDDKIVIQGRKIERAIKAIVNPKFKLGVCKIVIGEHVRPNLSIQMVVRH